MDWIMGKENEEGRVGGRLQHTSQKECAIPLEDMLNPKMLVKKVSCLTGMGLAQHQAVPRH